MRNDSPVQPDRREFLSATAAAVGAFAVAGSPSAKAAPGRSGLPESATATVTLGQSGLKCSLVGMGTGKTASSFTIRHSL